MAALDLGEPAMSLNSTASAAGPVAQGSRGALGRVMQAFYKSLLLLACLAMLAAFVTIVLGIVARQAGWDIPGLDAYAGYSIAAALFLALPETLQHGDHIRVTLVLQRLGPRARHALELWGLASGAALSVALAFYACRLVWVSQLTHDVSPSADATPLWIPQLSMALGCIGFALAFVDALLATLRGREFFTQGADVARVE
jgi:TRAP-type C4-dicarboxylate transport system permease small subunit